MRPPAVVASSVAGIAFAINFTNLGAVAERVAAEYGVGLATVGVLTTAVLLTHVATQIPAGRAVDRLGARRLTIVAILIIIAANGVLLVTPNPTLALVLRAVVGVGTGIGFVASSDFIRSSGGTALSQGIYGGIGYGATGVPLLVVPHLLGAAGWRAPYVLALVIALAALAFFLAAAPERARVPLAQAGREIQATRLFGDRRLHRLAAMHGIGLLGIVVGNWISTLYTRSFGLSVATAGLLGAATLLAGLLTRPLAGLLLHRRQDLFRPLLAAALVAGAAGAFALAVAPNPAVALGGGILLGLAAGVPFAPAMFGAGRVRPDAPAAAVGLVNALGNGMLIVATPLAGLTFALPGDGRIGFAAIGVVWLAGLLVLPRTEELESGRESRAVVAAPTPGR